MTEHTKTPWKLIYATDSAEYARIAGGIPTNIWITLEKGEARTENAEFIVKAVNSYDELVAALEKIGRVNAMDYEYQKWANQALEKAKVK